MGTNQSLELDHAYFSISKSIGFHKLEAMHEQGLPCVEIKRFHSLEELPENQLLSIRCATLSQNDLYLPSLLGVTREEVENWWKQPLDLEPYSKDILPYSFGLQKYEDPLEREKYRKIPIGQIPGLQFFYHRYFIDEFPGISGRLMISGNKIVIDIIRPHREHDFHREMREMQDIYDTVFIDENGISSSRKLYKECLSDQQLNEIIYSAKKILEFNRKEIDCRTHSVFLEWSYCFDVEKMSKVDPLHLSFWGMRAQLNDQISNGLPFLPYRT